MWRVLEEMQVPEELIQVVRMLYKDLVTHILCKGRVVGEFPMTSGIKQGCPLSGTLFALSLDPLIRY